MKNFHIITITFLAGLVLGASIPAHAATYINSGSSTDYVFCRDVHASEDTDGFHFGNCPDNGRSLTVKMIRKGVIKFNFIQAGFPAFQSQYAKEVAPGYFKDIKTHTVNGREIINTLTFSGDYVVIKSFDPAHPDDKKYFTQETFFLTEE